MFSEKEKDIIDTFYAQLDNLDGKQIELSWENGCVVAEFDTCFDDFSEEDENDEFTSFVFKVLKVEGVVPITISEDKYCIVNYHNFPKQITIL